MKPLELELRGFTAFRERTVVDFRGRRLFVITGPTGAGKSSLLDAMTWALYGEVPRVGKETRQLVSHGATVMAARLDFTVGSETYRVSRQVGRASAYRLERLLADGTWESLADRARDVTARVRALLGLDYATFTKTMLLPQGAFDAFLRGEPGERRDILANLLGLGVYEAMGRAGRARASGARLAATTIEQQRARLTLASAEAQAALEDERAELLLRR
ncbi:MAG: SMC family ATPase, partial [Chloroflexi bacterium]|nr:SMC family ATPase [Chloroflexota bacterium]